MKIVYSDPKTGKSAQMELEKGKEAVLLNHKVGDVVDASALGLTGYKLKITGGSDSSGFPMDRSVESMLKTKVLKRVSKFGEMKGQYKRKTVHGGVISEDIAQVNAVITEYGDKPATELFPEGKKAQEKAQEN